MSDDEQQETFSQLSSTNSLLILEPQHFKECLDNINPFILLVKKLKCRERRSFPRNEKVQCSPYCLRLRNHYQPILP